MRKFEVQLLDPFGNDSMTPCRLYAPSFMDLAMRLENAKISFRGITDVTRVYASNGYTFAPTPWPVEFAEK